MATTTNFGWETPDDTDLVKDGALAIRTLGNSIDTSLVDLKGGTTGQVLSKTSNTDMDFTWVTSDDANAIQNAIVDAKGDLIAASAADTPARLAVGNNGETLVADSSATTGLRWQGNYAAGKNAIINGDFRINQRNFTSTTTDATFTFDRWLLKTLGTGGTTTCSAQTFTLGTAPVAGYEGTNFVRLVTSGFTGTNTLVQYEQRIEDVRTFANQTVTVSFWAKSGSGTPNIFAYFAQDFGSGGSPSAQVFATAASVQSITTSWARYSFVISIPSISGKTLGTTANTSSLQFRILVAAGSSYSAPYNTVGVQNNTFDIWGVQVEAGNVATAFQTATGTLAGELAACQRYYVRFSGDGFEQSGFGYVNGTTSAFAWVPTPATLRGGGASSIEYAGQQILDYSGSTFTVTNLVIADKQPLRTMLTATISGATAGRGCVLRGTGTGSNYVGLSAEL